MIGPKALNYKTYITSLLEQKDHLKILYFLVKCCIRYVYLLWEIMKCNLLVRNVCDKSSENSKLLYIGRVQSVLSGHFPR